MITSTVEKRKTVADYEQLPEGAPFQLIDGTLVKTPSPTPTHQEISIRIVFALLSFVRANDLGKVYHAPIDVVLSDDCVFQPDILFISKERTGIIGEKNIQGAPDLVIEILSFSTAYYDLRQKRAAYERAGVREYWIVDPMMQSIEIHENRSGTFSLVVELHRGETARSVTLAGFTIELDQVFS